MQKLLYLPLEKAFGTHVPENRVYPTLTRNVIDKLHEVINSTVVLHHSPFPAQYFL